MPTGVIMGEQDIKYPSELRRDGIRYKLHKQECKTESKHEGHPINHCLYYPDQSGDTLNGINRWKEGPNGR